MVTSAGEWPRSGTAPSFSPEPSLASALPQLPPLEVLVDCVAATYQAPTRHPPGTRQVPARYLQGTYLPESPARLRAAQLQRRPAELSPPHTAPRKHYTTLDGRVPVPVPGRGGGSAGALTPVPLLTTHCF